jgi:hypothetical protein
MSQAAGRAAMQAGKAAAKSAEGNVLNKGAKRDPELYVRTLNPIPNAFHIQNSSSTSWLDLPIGMLMYYSISRFF